MHSLYLQYLSCKGEWTKCQLVVSVKKTNGSDFVETFEFLTKSKLEEEVGAELAADLIARHIAAEEKLEPSKKGQFIKKNLVTKSILYDCALEFDLATTIDLEVPHLAKEPRFSHPPRPLAVQELYRHQVEEH